MADFTELKTGLKKEFLSNHPHPMQSVFTALTRKYPYEVTSYREEAFRRTDLVVAFTDRNNVRYTQTVMLKDEDTHRFKSPQDQVWVVAELLEEAARKLTVDIGEEVTGKYPFARLWCDRHVNVTSDRVPFWCNPNKKIPGWAWPKIKSQIEYPQDKQGIISSPIGDDGRDPFTEEERRKRRFFAKVDLDTVPGPITTADKIMEEVKSMATKKVKVVKKAIDPTKVKKPECKVHYSPMDFDPVSQKWRCGEEGCNMVARPKDEGEDRSVRIGKGNVQCRLISQNGEQTVILISDDNVALDITRFADVEKLLDIFDAVSIADAASENGRENFSINDPKQLPVNMSLTVMGATDLAIAKSDKD